MKFITFLSTVLFFVSCSFGGELEETKRIAPKYNAQVEVRLWDNTRVDLLSDRYAYEVDWSHKYAEGIGQALYYSSVTNRRPGLILLVYDSEAEQRFIYRAQTVCTAHGITLHLEKVNAPALTQQVVFATDNPVRVYMVYDPVDNKWHTKNTFGLSTWGEQQSGEVWTKRREAERTLAGMLSERAARCQIKAFVLIPATDDK